MMAGIDAGDFGTWLRQVHAVLRGSAASRVPCGDCTGCCTSGYSIQVRPADAPALAHIPAHALFRARGSAANHWTVRPDAAGRCPMLKDSRCSIYAQRPQTCLDYDCRVFAAAGIQAGGADKSVINQRVQAWRFRFTGDEDQQAHAAIKAAATFVREQREHFPSGYAPVNPLGVAALALRVYPVFLPPGPPRRVPDTVRAMLAASAQFEQAVQA